MKTKKNNNSCIDSIKNSFRILKLDGLGTSIHGKYVQILKIMDPFISILVDLQSAQNLYSQVHIVLMNTIIKKWHWFLVILIDEWFKEVVYLFHFSKKKLF